MVEFGPDGKPKTVYSSPKADATDDKSQYDWQTKSAEIAGKQATLKQKAEAAAGFAAAHHDNVSKYAAAVSVLDQQISALKTSAPVVPDSDRKSRQEQRDRDGQEPADC